MPEPLQLPLFPDTAALTRIRAEARLAAAKQGTRAMDDFGVRSGSRILDGRTGGTLAGNGPSDLGSQPALPLSFVSLGQPARR